MSTFTYLLAAVAVVAVLSGRAECRPQTPETRDVEPVGGDGIQQDTVDLGARPLPGAVLGEIRAYTDDIFVVKQQRNKKKPRTGPSASALVSGPAEVSVGASRPAGASFGVSAGLTLVPSQAKVEIASAR